MPSWHYLPAPEFVFIIPQTGNPQKEKPAGPEKPSAAGFWR